MEDKNKNHQSRIEVTNSNIIFGTSSDDIQRGLHHQQFLDPSDITDIDDKDLIVNEEVQNEIVNPTEETFNEELAPSTLTPKATGETEAEDNNNPETGESHDTDPDSDSVNQERKTSTSGDE